MERTKPLSGYNTKCAHMCDYLQENINICEIKKWKESCLNNRKQNKLCEKVHVFEYKENVINNRDQSKSNKSCQATNLHKRK